MIWRYKLERKEDNKYIYRYSFENTAFDGVIVCSMKNLVPIIDTPCSWDDGHLESQLRSIEHFYEVIKKGFPSDLNVYTG